LKDNELILAFRPIVVSALAALGYANVAVVQAYQPTQQGVSNTPTVFFYKVYDHRYGYMKRLDTWDVGLQQMVHTENQVFETSFQVEALVTQNPANINQVTASDLVNAVAQILQTDKTIEALFVSGIQILRISEIRNPYFVDDRGRFEAVPSFDFILTHNFISVTENPVIESIQPGIYRI
jgi:hypothetical protein